MPKRSRRKGSREHRSQSFVLGDYIAGFGRDILGTRRRRKGAGKRGQTRGKYRWRNG